MLIVANWKAYVETAERAKQLFALSKRLSNLPRVSLVLAPAAPQLGALALNNRSKVAFAAQDLSATTGGPHTGEVSAQIFAASGASYAIIGHSERRAGETPESIAAKLQHAIAHDLTPILCVGESERDPASKYLNEVRAEMTAALEALEPKDRARVIIAYEPLWAINKSAEDSIAVTDLAEMVLYIRKVLAELLPGKVGKTKVLYGGSAEPENIRGLAGGSGVDGFLVGHASIDPKIFTALVKALT